MGKAHWIWVAWAGSAAAAVVARDLSSTAVVPDSAPVSVAETASRRVDGVPAAARLQTGSASVQLGETYRQIQLTVAKPTPTPRPNVPWSAFVTTNFPVQVGIPIPEGELFDHSKARLLENGSPVPVQQMKALGYWRKPGNETNGIKWLQVAFNANVAAMPPAYVLEYGPAVSPPAEPPLYEEAGADDYVVKTGPLRFRVNKVSPTLIDDAWLDVNGDGIVCHNPSQQGNCPSEERVILPSSAQKGLYFVDQAGTVYRASGGSSDELIVEDEELPQPQQVTLKARGRFYSSAGVAKNRWVVRIKAYKGKPFIRLFHTIIFDEPSIPLGTSDPGTNYRDIGIELPLNLGAAVPVVSFARGPDLAQTVTPERPEHVNYGHTNYGPGGGWIQPAITGADSSLMLRQERHDEYRVYKNGSPIAVVGESKRAGHWFDISRDGAGGFGLTGTVRWFWQNYPSAFEYAREGSTHLARFHLWRRRSETSAEDLNFTPKAYLKSMGNPTTAGDRWEAFDDVVFPAREQCPAEMTCGGGPGCMRATGVGVAKTHELTIEFHPGKLQPGSMSIPPETAFFVQRPPLVYATDPSWIATTRGFGRIHGRDSTNFPEVDGKDENCPAAGCGKRQCKANNRCQTLMDVFMEQRLLEQEHDGKRLPTDLPAGALAAWGDSYGAFDFGETLHEGKDAHRYWMHNRFYLPDTFWIWYARDPNQLLFDFAEANSRHVMDIDTIHVGQQFSDPCGSGSQYFLPAGTPLGGNVGLIHWAIPPKGAMTNPTGAPPQLLPTAALLGAGGFLAHYYYLTGYERAKDVAEEFAKAVEEVREKSPAYYTQTPGRGLGLHVVAATKLYELTGNAALEESARDVAMRMIGRNPQGQLDPSTNELAEYLVDPDPTPLGLAYGQGYPADEHLAYMLPAAAVYAELTGDENVWQWLRTQAEFIRNHNFHQFPNRQGNHWMGMAAAYHRYGDPTYLGVGAADFDRIKHFDRHDIAPAAYSAFPFFNLPYLMEALASAGVSSVQRIVAPDSTGGEVLIHKHQSGEGDRVIIGAERNTRRSDILNETTWCSGCQVYLRLRDSNGVERAPQVAYPGLLSGAASVRSRIWYNRGGWITDFALPSDAGTYRIRIEIENLDSVPEPLFQLFVRGTSGPGPLNVMVSGGNGDGLSPGYRYDYERRRWAFVPNAQVPGQPVQFTFKPFAANYRLLFNAFDSVNQPALSGSGELIGTGGGTDTLVTVGAGTPGAPRNQYWSFDLGPAFKPYQFGYNCPNVPSPPGGWPASCITYAKYNPPESRGFVTSGVVPYFSQQLPTGGFAPSPLWKIVATEPSQNISTLPTDPPEIQFKWRAIAGATAYTVGYNDGRKCGQANYLTPISPLNAGCPFGTGICRTAVRVCTQADPPPPTPCIYRGTGQWYVKGSTDAGPDPHIWTTTLDTDWGTLLAAPEWGQAVTPSARPTLKFQAVANATHYDIWINDSQAQPRVHKTFIVSRPGCNPSECQAVCNSNDCQVVIPASEPELAGSATWWVQANCSTHWSQAFQFDVP
jgi:hypothetical protein